VGTPRRANGIDRGDAAIAPVAAESDMGGRMCASKTPARCPVVAPAGARATERGGSVLSWLTSDKWIVSSGYARVDEIASSADWARQKRPSFHPTLRKARAKLKNSGRADPSRSAPRRCLTPRGRRRDASGGWDRHRRGWRGT
jgi:hypothetical protein